MGKSKSSDHRKTPKPLLTRNNLGGLVRHPLLRALDMLRQARHPYPLHPPFHLQVGALSWPDPVWRRGRLTLVHGGRNLHGVHPTQFLLGLHPAKEILPSAECVVVQYRFAYG